MDEDSLAGKSDAELKAEMQRIQREFEARQRLKKEQQLEARRRNVGEDSTPSGQTLAPASPSPRKKIKNGACRLGGIPCIVADRVHLLALMKPVQTNASKTLLDSHKLALARRTRHERDYALPSFQKVGSNSKASSSTSRSKREDADLATMLEDDAASRLAQQKRIGRQP